MPAEPMAALPPGARLALRQGMTRDAGVVRNAVGLTRLLDQIDGLDRAHGRTGESIAARLVATSALERRESRGGHFREDYPRSRAPRRSFVTLGRPVAIAAE